MTRIISVLLIAIGSLFVFSGCGEDKSETDLAKESTNPTGVMPPGKSAGISSELIDRIIVPFNKGVALMERFQPVKAIKTFEEVVKLAPDWVTGRLNYGIALMNGQSDKYYARAEEELKWVIEKEPNNPYAHFVLGMLLRYLTRFDEAKAQFEAVLEIDPEDADAHYQVGILVMDDDPAAAQYHLEKTLEKIPHHESACYRLGTLMRRQGNTKRARELFTRFRALKNSGAGVFFGMKYGEMGHYAQVIRSFENSVEELEPDSIPSYIDIAKESGLTAVAAGTAGWPGENDQRTAAAFAPGIAVANVEGKGKLAIYITGIGPNGGGELYRYKTGRFFKVKNTGIDGHNAIGAYFGDYDADGDPDLYLTCAGPNRLYRNDGGSRFTDVTEVSGVGGGSVLSVGAAWADADHDGDLDLYVANFCSLTQGITNNKGAPNFLWRNNRNGSFTEVAVETEIGGGSVASTGVLFFDCDDDRDIDLYIINQNSPNRLFLNDRVGQYTDATSWYPLLADDGPGLGALLGDLNRNGREDILLLRGPKPPRLFLQVDRAQFLEDQAFAAIVRDLGGATGGIIGDLDLDGDSDVLLLSVGSSGKIEHQILMNKGSGSFAAPVPLGEMRENPDSRGAVAVDFDGDGSLEIIVTRVGAPPELWKGAAPKERHWLEVIPVKGKGEKDKWIDPTADGLLVEVKSGRHLQVASLTAAAGYLSGPLRQVHFGLDEYTKADYVRLSWTTGVFQSEMEVAADQQWRITKMKRKPSSCPILFSWNGERFTFVTDFLGGGGLGFFITPGEYAPPDPTEDIRIPPELIEPKEGRYLLRVADPLEEATYLDQVHLIAYDHPGDWEIYPDERFTITPPFATGQPFAVGEKIFPQEARDEMGKDVLNRILEIDRHYVDVPNDERFTGYADDHWLELDFGNQLRGFASDASLVLYLYGWVEYTYSHVNYASYQAGITMRSPWIEIPDEKGEWSVAIPEIGFPAGLPRMMTLDISSLPIREKGRLRIRTNMEVFWDQIFIGENVLDPEIRVNTLKPVVAELRRVGYPREFSPDGADPTIYDYDRIDQGVPFMNMTGSFTRFGDVRALLDRVDDRFVIMARGEEIALEFDATALPKLTEGWNRTFVLHTDGYCKDMDLYTAFPNTVDPLPFHKMKNYPPEKAAPNLKELEKYQRTWNTRYIEGK